MLNNMFETAFYESNQEKKQMSEVNYISPKVMDLETKQPLYIKDPKVEPINDFKITFGKK